MPPSSAFEKKLAEAQSGQSKKRKKIFGYGVLAVSVALAVAAFSYLAIQLDRARTQLRATEQTEQAEQAEQAAQPFDEYDITAPPQNKNTDDAQPADSVATDADAGADSYREQFMAQLAAYESEVEPQITATHLSDWDEEKHNEVERLKAHAVEEFTDGEYLLARESLRRARALAAEAVAEHASALTAFKRAAVEAFENDRAPEAERALQQALRLSPTDAEMLALQKRVAMLAQVLDGLREAEVARTENRPAKEAAALQKVVAADPSRQSAKSRLQAVQAQLKQQRFTAAVEAARDALAAGDLPDAEKQIARAKAVFPAHEALEPLQNQLKQARTEREFAKQMSLGEQAEARDDWAAAVAHFARAQRLKPNDESAVARHNAARRVVGATKEISQMLAREHRLGDANILASATAYLRETEPVTAHSPRLRELHRELAHKVDLYATEVEVVVVSDNATYIIVRGEGRVGKTARRTIRLRPGKRVFEGSRSGYKSKLVTLDIAPGASSVEVTVICDEKI